MADFKDYESYDGLGLAELVRHKQVSPSELLDAALARVERYDPKIAACVHLVEDVARKHIAKGLGDGPFAGVPFLLKDLGCEAKDFPASSGSRLFADTHWTFDSEIFLRMERIQAVEIGRPLLREPFGARFAKICKAAPSARKSFGCGISY